jgi:hypothetical protein
MLILQGLKGLSQDVPDWLQDAADGKLPPLEDPYAQTNSWGGGFGSCFGNKEDEQKPAVNGENPLENGGTENVGTPVVNGVGGHEEENNIKKEPTENGVNVEVKLKGRRKFWK